MISWIWIIVAISIAFHGVCAVYNVTVDDTDPSINYIGTWIPLTASNHYGGTSHYTKTTGSSASFTFTGATQVHFMGLAITGDMDSTMRIVFDGRTRIVDMWRDQRKVYQVILWSSDTLDPSNTHTITCQKSSDSGGGRDLYLDAFIMTLPDPVASSQTSTSSLTPSILPSTGSAPTSSSTTAVITGSVSTSMTQTTVINASTTNSTIVWNPSNSGVTIVTPPDSLDTTSASGTSDFSSANTTSSDLRSTPTAAIVGCVFGVAAFICIVAAIIFNLSRKRGAKTEPNTTRVRGSSWDNPNFATVGGSTMEISGSSTLGLQMKGMATREALSEGSLTSPSPISENPTSIGRNWTSAHHSEHQTQVSESQTWTTANPPAYTLRPISGHLHAAGETLSEFTGLPRDVSTQYTQESGEVQGRRSLSDSPFLGEKIEIHLFRHVD
ncbi:hypothetical protein FRC20_010101 [Serendipita sp. 405]|nr:hypothetical protein FRC20_010101 [Serendipita sp. 405]